MRRTQTSSFIALLHLEGPVHWGEDQIFGILGKFREKKTLDKDEKEPHNKLHRDQI